MPPSSNSSTRYEVVIVVEVVVVGMVGMVGKERLEIYLHAVLMEEASTHV
jgi:hypothetical protein